MTSSLHGTDDYARQVTPLSCEREPIHIVNRIQPCGTLLVVDSELTIVQCSTNAVYLLPEGFELKNSSKDGNNSGDDDDDMSVEDKRARLQLLLDAIIGAPLSLLGITQSGEHFLLEIEDSDHNNSNKKIGGSNTTTTNSVNNNTSGDGNRSSSSTEKQQEAADVAEGEEETMLFMQSIAHELSKCWSIEEMAGLVCSRIMSETPYDRGMVYRFDASDDSGEVIYETTRWDASRCCREDSFLGLRFPASDIPRQARELFMKNTLRFVYDVQGNDYPLYPSKIRGDMIGGGETEKYTDLSMCRLRGSSYIHLEYLRNMKVTSSLVIAIIVNKRLWGLYSFHGYRHPIRPSARSRFLCEMASVMTCEYHGKRL